MQVWLGHSPLRGESGAVGRGAHAVLPLPGHGLVLMLTAENDFGELEDYFVLSGASAKRRSEVFGGGTRISR